MDLVESTSAPASSSSSGPLPIPPDRAVEAPGFDLEGYIIRYSGNTKIARLHLVAQTCPALQLEAYQVGAPCIRRVFKGRRAPLLRLRLSSRALPEPG